jgi:phage shock protein E
MQLLKIALLGVLLLAGSSLAGERQAVWIDVRSAEEYAESHIEGTINIPHTRIAEGVVEMSLQPHDTIYVFCRSGRRSALARDVLRTVGFRQVTDLKTVEKARKKWEQEQAAAAAS